MVSGYHRKANRPRRVTDSPLPGLRRGGVGTRRPSTTATLRLCVKNLLACGGVAGRDEFLQAQPLEVLGEETRELAPFGIVARQENRLATERIGIEVEVGVDLLLDVGVLRVGLVVLRTLRLCQLSVFAHGNIISDYRF